MGLEVFTNAGEYLERISPTLLGNEAVNGLILGIADQLVEMPQVYSEPPFMATVEQGGQLRLAALMTPPFHLLLAAAGEPENEDISRVAGYLLEAGWSVPGVNAEKELAKMTARVWQGLTGSGTHVHMEMRLFDLQTVIPPAKVNGSLRLAQQSDLQQVTAWTLAFDEEAVGQHRPDHSSQMAEQRVKAGLVYLWEDARPVSMAVCVRQSLHGAVIGGVYTPPELRGRGYASACVAAMSQVLLDGGKDFCALFTDLSNPTSNHIYQAIGYRPVCDWLDINFQGSAW